MTDRELDSYNEMMISKEKKVKMSSNQKKLIEATLANDEESSDAELIQYFVSQGIDLSEAEKSIKLRNDFLKSPLTAKLI